MKTLISLVMLSMVSAFPVIAADSSGSPPKPPCCREIEPGRPLTDRSVYHLDSEWTSDFDRRIPLSAFAGRPQVVAMFFTHCEYACPIIVHDLRRIEAALPAEVRDSIDFLLVTMDHERDTPAVLRAYRDLRKLPTDRWSLLHGDADAVRELAAVLGVSYRKDSRGQFLHSNIVTLLNAEGEIVRQLTGLNQEIGSFVAAITAAAGH